ncbi:MAG: hypothetical protein ACI4GD_06555 [Lachnospiraceae bacterium]
MTKSMKLLVILALIALALASMLKITVFSTNPDNYEHSIERIDGNISTVMKLAASSSAASAIISFLPDDSCTPIANELAELSKYFLIVLSALYLEKYLMTVIGYASFGILIPLACVIMIIYICLKKEMLVSVAAKIIIFAIALWSIIPCSTKVSDLIYKTYEKSIENTIISASEVCEENESATGLMEKIKSMAGSAVEYVSTLLSGFVEALAIMIVISCFIPIIVILAFVFLLKIIFGIEIPVRTGLKNI